MDRGGGVRRPADWGIEEAARRCGVNRAREEEAELIFIFYIFFTRSLSAGTRPLLFIVLLAVLEVGWLFCKKDLEVASCCSRGPRSEQHDLLPGPVRPPHGRNIS